MSNLKIIPEKITRPIQLLAAWLTGLVIVDCSFLIAAAKINSPSWASSALVVASIINVPLFLICIFILQTKFRPEMLADVYYSKYLELRETITEEIKRKAEQETEDLKVEINQELLEELKQITEKEPELQPYLEELLKASSTMMSDAIIRSREVEKEIQEKYVPASILNEIGKFIYNNQAIEFRDIFLYFFSQGYSVEMIHKALHYLLNEGVIEADGPIDRPQTIIRYKKPLFDEGT